MDVNELYDFADERGFSVHDFALPVLSLSIQDADGEYHIALDRTLHRQPQHEKLCLAHEIAHCETDGLYPLDADNFERGRLEYRADKWTVVQLVPWREYRSAILDGCFTDWEQADYWDVPVEYIPTVHKVYERTRWDDVQELKRAVAREYTDW